MQSIIEIKQAAIAELKAIKAKSLTRNRRNLEELKAWKHLQNDAKAAGIPQAAADEAWAAARKEAVGL